MPDSSEYDVIQKNSRAAARVASRRLRTGQTRPRLRPRLGRERGRWQISRRTSSGKPPFLSARAAFPRGRLDPPPLPVQNMAMNNTQIGFLGAGQMARALAAGFVHAGLITADQVRAADAVPAAAMAFCEAVPGAHLADSNRRLVEQSDMIILAVKPQHVAQALASARSAMTADKWIVSIVAGVTILNITRQLGTDRILRVMPNTPCLVGQGAAAFARSASITDEEADFAASLLRSVGYVVELGEPLLDTVTGLSGSGPAFVYQIIEALSDGGVNMGLSREVATQLAAHTVRGAAEMLLRTGQHPAVLKDQVASPGGTTIAGLRVLEQTGLRSALMGAVEAATRRSRELGEMA